MIKSDSKKKFMSQRFLKSQIKAQKYEAAQLFFNIGIIRNVSRAVNQIIIMISEDHVTEDWRNDAENTALITEINYILPDIHIDTIYLNL